MKYKIGNEVAVQNPSKTIGCVKIVDRMECLFRNKYRCVGTSKLGGDKVVLWIPEKKIICLYKDLPS